MSDQPVSLSEYKALRDADCSKWSPLDVLEYIRKKIVAKEINPSALIICYEVPVEDGLAWGCAMSATSNAHAIGIMEMCKWDICENV
jgi:hypothetical protein